MINLFDDPRNLNVDNLHGYDADDTVFVDLKKYEKQIYFDKEVLAERNLIRLMKDNAPQSDIDKALRTIILRRREAVSTLWSWVIVADFPVVVHAESCPFSVGIFKKGNELYLNCYADATDEDIPESHYVELFIAIMRSMADAFMECNDDKEKKRIEKRLKRMYTAIGNRVTPEDFISKLRRKELSLL